MPQNTYLQTILNAFENFDLETLKALLKRKVYQDTTKEIFLKELEIVFIEFRDVHDTRLIMYPGECLEKELCDNCGKKGFRFVGDKSNNYFDLIFDMDGDDVKDIFDCSKLKTESTIENLKHKIHLVINEEDKVTFVKTEVYKDKIKRAYEAYAEIITNPPKELDFNDLGKWIEKHAVSNAIIGSYDPFEPAKKWSEFSSLYDDLRKSKNYISKNYHQILLANELLSNAKEEQDFIDWVIKYHKLFISATLDLIFDFSKEEIGFVYKKQNPIIFKGDVFNHTYHFLNSFQKYNEELLHKYSTYTAEENIAAKNNIDYSKKVDIFSIMYHLGRRKELAIKGIELPYYLVKK
jgi:Zn-finger protein